MADLNRDGLLDLVVGHHFGSASENGPGVPIRVYMNRGLDGSANPIFDDITSDIGLPAINSKAPHVDIQDFDNDGWPDLYVSVTVDSGSGPEPLIFRNTGSLVGGDPKGLYAKARAGEITNMTGLDSPYEEPTEPELRLDSANETPEVLARTLVDTLPTGSVNGN
jgi:hypothetical protein